MCELTELNDKNVQQQKHKLKTTEKIIKRRRREKRTKKITDCLRTCDKNSAFTHEIAGSKPEYTYIYIQVYEQQ